MARNKNHAWNQTSIGFIQLSQHLSVSHQAFIQFVHADREGHMQASAFLVCHPVFPWGTTGFNA